MSDQNKDQHKQGQQNQQGGGQKTDQQKQENKPGGQHGDADKKNEQQK